MTLPMFLGLLAVFSVLTSYIVEFIKKDLQEHDRVCACNMLVLLVALVIGILGTAAFYIMTEVSFTSGNVMCMFLMGIAVWLVAMVGYDKVVQLIKQMAEIAKLQNRG